MDCLPSVVWINERIPVELDLGADATSGRIAIQYADNRSGFQPNNAYVFTQTITLRRKAGGGQIFAGNLELNPSYPLGDWNYQVWTNQGRNKRCCFNGTFTLAASFDANTALVVFNDDGTVTNATAETQTVAERQLQVIEDKIHNLLATGVQSFTLSGNSTTRVSLQGLYRERHRLFETVNRERRARGLPFLPGTQARLKRHYGRQ